MPSPTHKTSFELTASTKPPCNTEIFLHRHSVFSFFCSSPATDKCGFFCLFCFWCFTCFFLRNDESPPVQRTDFLFEYEMEGAVLGTSGSIKKLNWAKHQQQQPKTTCLWSGILASFMALSHLTLIYYTSITLCCCFIMHVLHGGYVSATVPHSLHFTIRYIALP